MLIYISSLLILFMFFISGINKFFSINETSEGLKKRFPLKQLPFVFYQYVIICVVLLQFFSPIIIVVSLKKKHILGKISCYALAFFTFLATLLYHWPPEGHHYYSVMSNINATGGLLLLSTYFK